MINWDGFGIFKSSPLWGIKLGVSFTPLSPYIIDVGIYANGDRYISIYIGVSHSASLHYSVKRRNSILKLASKYMYYIYYICY